ncbi:MAG: hypothetical protein WAL52_23295 [Candidatus Sulfotelmatobacter sp.]
MTRFNSLLVLLFLISPAVCQQSSQPADPIPDQGGGGAILYSEGGAFMIAAPKGWSLDREVGQRLGTCCVFYPEGSTWDDAETVIYPNIVSKGPGQQTLHELMASDLNDFRDHNPKMSFEDGEEIRLKNHGTAKVRYFYNVNQGSSEAVAYVDEEKIIALVVVSSKTRKGLNESIPLLRSALQTYAYMDVRLSNKVKASSGPSAQSPKD